MNKKIRIVFTLLTIILIAFSYGKAENNIDYIIKMKLDEKIIDEIREQVEMPNDYDISRAMKGMEYLIIYEGFSVPGAAGLIGNGYAESRLLINPGKGLYKGLFQWHGKARWPRIQDYLELNKVDFENEEDLYLWELSAAINSEEGIIYKDVIDFCKNCDDANESAKRWCKKYEGVTQSLYTRKKIAGLTVDVYELYMNILINDAFNRFKSKLFDN